MQKQISVRDLINGMQNVSRMRGEIGLVVSGLTSRLRKVPVDELNRKLLYKRTRLVLEEGNVMWVVYRPSLDTNRVAIECWKKSSSMVFSTGWQNEQDDIALVHVEFVYNGLQVLVDGLLECFPQIREVAENVSRLAHKFD